MAELTLRYSFPQELEPELYAHLVGIKSPKVRYEFLRNLAIHGWRTLHAPSVPNPAAVAPRVGTSGLGGGFGGDVMSLIN